MSTTELTSATAGSELPVTAEELAKLASQIYAQLTPQQVSPVASGSPVVPEAPAVSSPPEPPAVGAIGSAWPPGPGSVARGGPGLSGHRPVVAGVQRAVAPWGRPAWTSEPAAPGVGRLPGLGARRGLGEAPRGLPPKSGASSEIFDVRTVREDFPILSEQVHGHPLIWFDNAATTQKPQQVIDRLARFYAHENSNIHRAAHELAARATDAYEDARDTVRDFLGASRSEEIVFVRGATEGINLVAQSWGRKNLRPGDEILITQLEHHANIVPWQIVAQTTGATLTVAPVDDQGNLLLDDFTRLLGPRTKLVAVTGVANAIGTVTPVQTITSLARQAGARVLIDGAQSVPHLAVDLGQLDADFFVFSGHKVFGPTGIGAVYIAERVWEETPAWQGGGNMIADVEIQRSLYQGPPNKYEAGTGNIADAVGLAEALRYVTGIGLHRIEAYEHSLLDYATPRLAAIDGVRLVGTAAHKASVLSFVLDGHDPEEVGAALNRSGIAVRAGHHCAQPILRRLGVEKTVRPSFAFYNTIGEIDVFLAAVVRIAEGAGGRSR
ncbi:MAG TPA: SufS family cysteine desulfurase [Arachnia sp.]|nr:SufS family cysteine desulfurase [Arachnia sp.]HMT87474.1 SufS family cysteine desulfurase [Arachnia sp.]